MLTLPQGNAVPYFGDAPRAYVPNVLRAPMPCFQSRWLGARPACGNAGRSSAPLQWRLPRSSLAPEAYILRGERNITQNTVESPTDRPPKFGIALYRGDGRSGRAQSPTISRPLPGQRRLTVEVDGRARDSTVYAFPHRINNTMRVLSHIERLHHVSNLTLQGREDSAGRSCKQGQCACLRARRVPAKKDDTAGLSARSAVAASTEHTDM